MDSERQDVSKKLRRSNKRRLWPSAPRKKRNVRKNKKNKDPVRLGRTTPQQGGLNVSSRLNNKTDLAPCCDVIVLIDQVTDSENLELCKKIRDSLKQLRQSETGEKETLRYIENKETSQNPEAVPDESKKPHGTEKIEREEENVTGNVIKEEQTEFYDESRTPEVSDEDERNEVLIQKRPTPMKRNPKRKTQQKKADLLQNEPQLEKVFVTAIKKPVQCKKVTKRDLETSEMPSHFDHTEELYEYGKYVAEQMLCFDEKDVRLAQAEITDVLTKFRLKYKILNCLSQPTNQSEIDAKRRKASNCMSQTNCNGRKVAKLTTQVNSNRRKVTKITSKVNSNRQKVTKNAISGPSVSTNSPKLESNVSFNDSVLNMNSLSSVAPLGLGLVIEPLSATGGFSISTQRLNSMGTVVSQSMKLQDHSRIPVTEPGTISGTSMSQPTLEGNILGSSVTKLGSPICNGTSMIQATVPELTNVNIVESRMTKADNSKIPRTSFEMPPTHFIKAVPYNVEQELTVKNELESEDET